MSKIPLPPAKIRMAGVKYKDDTYFINSGVGDAKRLHLNYEMNNDSDILDLGCGPGRLLVGLVESGLPFKSYIGIDVLPGRISWAQKHLHPWGTFILSKDKNERYNAKGKKVTADTRIPLDDESVNIVFCSSLFTHMRLRDTKIYLKEIARILKPGGCVHATFFERFGQIKAEEENPSNKQASALLRVCLSHSAIMGAISAAGLALVERCPDHKAPSQTELKLVKA